jgi:hypothetical protein
MSSSPRKGTAERRALAKKVAHMRTDGIESQPSSVS